MQTGWWIGDFIANGQVSFLAAWVFWVIVSICLHELAHGWAALWQGDDTPRRMGHLTINPIVHMGYWSLIVFALTGIAWGAMPVDPSRFRWRRFGDVVVSAAGPAMNVLLAAICLTALGVVLANVGTGGNATQGQQRLIEFLFLGGRLNLVLVLLNLMPVPPLDGSRILGGFIPKLNELFQQPFVQFAGIFVIFILIGGLLRGPVGQGLNQFALAWASTVAGFL